VFINANKNIIQIKNVNSQNSWLSSLIGRDNHFGSTHLDWLGNANDADNHIRGMTMTMLGLCPYPLPKPNPNPNPSPIPIPHPISHIHSQDCPVLSSPLQKAFVCLRLSRCSLSVDAAASVNGDNNFLNWNWMKWFAYNIIYTMNANKLRRTKDENEMRPSPSPLAFPF